ncbi:hypothetical protein GCM10023115_49970 [Pontixanthobacter gangjinensis]
MASLLSLSCSINGGRPDDIEIVDLRINHFQQTGFGLRPQLVYQIQESGEIGGDAWKFHYDEIEGFNYEPGYVYDLRASKLIDANPPQDASAIKYILLKVRSKQKVAEGENFDIKLKFGGENFVTRDGVKNFLLDRYEIDCDILCTDLDDYLENNPEVTGTFVHQPDRVLKLMSLR